VNGEGKLKLWLTEKQDAMGTQRSQNTHLALFHHCRHNSPCVHRTSLPKVCTGKLSDTCIGLFHTYYPYLYVCNKQANYSSTRLIVIRW